MLWKWKKNITWICDKNGPLHQHRYKSHLSFFEKAGSRLYFSWSPLFPRFFPPQKHPQNLCLINPRAVGRKNCTLRAYDTTALVAAMRWHCWTLGLTQSPARPNLLIRAPHSLLLSNLSIFSLLFFPTEVQNFPDFKNT